VTYRVEVAPPVRQELRQLPGSVRAQAVRLIDALADDPRPLRAQELRGKPQVYRIWLAGRWRIAYQIDDDRRVLRILRVRRKDDIDYETL
jgi:mRNA-degrading endonuclease RelE of RelBE toxin-antitoxin system